MLTAGSCTCRYIFIELASPADASLACRLMDEYPFDKRHRFAVNRFTDIEKLADLDEEYQEPPAEEYQDREHLKSWLLDPAGRDQLVMCRNDDVQIAWHNRSSAPEISHERQVRLSEVDWPAPSAETDEIAFFAALDRILCPMVATRNLFDHLPQAGYRALGRCILGAFHEVRSPRCASGRLLAQREVHGHMVP